MKTKVWLVTLFSVLCAVYASDLMAQKESNTATVYFYVEAMECNNCKARIEKNIAFEKGVTDLECDLPSKMVAVTYRKDKTNPEKLARAFEKLKLPVKVVPVADKSKEKKEKAKTKEKTKE